ncbi:DUF2256 domain-containing protein [Rhodospirillales bacterium]|nr:DUF2256 domain-containing protein [Rhodospirillales bacterium]
MRKGNLPYRICYRCGRTFLWRKKWENCWSNVRYCSTRCRNSR